MRRPSKSKRANEVLVERMSACCSPVRPSATAARIANAAGAAVHQELVQDVGGVREEVGTHVVGGGEQFLAG
jgi:hypothetical protein